MQVIRKHHKILHTLFILFVQDIEGNESSVCISHAGKQRAVDSVRHCKIEVGGQRPKGSMSAQFGYD
jgi:hypothetical protein